MKIKLLFVILFFSVVGRGQTVVASGMGTITCPAATSVTWTTPPTGLTFSQISRGAGVTCATGSTGTSGSGFNVTLANAISGSKWYKFSITSDAATPFTVSAIAIQSQVSSAAGSPNVSVRYSIGGTSPTTVIGSFTPTTSSVSYPFSSLNIAVGASQVLNIYVIPNNLTASTTTCRVENATSVTIAPPPTITLSPTTLSGFSYVLAAGPSANLTFTASGVNLTTDIVLTPPANYEISTASGSGFGSTITLTQSAGTVNTTTIYIRLKAGLAIGNYNSETVSATSTGSTTKNVTCSGSVTAFATPTITLSPATLSGFSYLSGSGPSANQTYTVNGVDLTNDILLTPPTNYEISTSAGSGFGSTITLTQTLGNVSSTTIYVRLKSGLVVGNYNGETVVATSAGATTKSVVCNGNVSVIAPCLTSNFDSSTIVPSGWGGSSVNDAVSSHLQSPSNCRALANGKDLITSAIDNPASIDFYVDASSSGGQIGTLEYRIGAGAWTTIGTFTATTAGATVSYSLTSAPNLSTTANVSFRISSAGNTIYIDDLNAYCYSSSLTPTIIVTPATLTGFSYIFGSGPSSNQSFIVSGTNLTTDIVLTPPTNYEISTDIGTWNGGSITLYQTAGVVDITTIYVRLKTGLSIGNYNGENILLTSTGAAPKNTSCSGSVNTSTNSITSDIIAVLNSESITVSSIMNDAVINTNTDGVQVWQFTIRDGGSVLDPDTLSTIVNTIVITQNSGNSINDWSDAIQTVALFNGATKIADGVVTSTNITFTGAPLISVPDNGSVTLSIRLSLQINPNNSGLNLDGDDFVFSIDHANLVESPLGSQFKSLGVVSSINGKNVLDVLATDFVYTQQPTNTGQNATMASVKITATDVNGNRDIDFVGNVSVTSTGTMSSSPQTSVAIAGIATFSTIIHTALGFGLTLSASSTGINTLVSPSFDISINTTFQPGDLAILAVNTAAESSGSADEISFVCFQDILPGTAFYLTDNGYERVYAGKWGNTEGIISLTRTNTLLPKGTIITIHTTNGGVNDGTDFTIYTCGLVDSNWTKGVASPSTYFFDLNKDDQVWITQGGTWSNTATGNHDMTYNGNVLYGWTDIPWKTAINYASTKGSTVYPKRECYTTDVNNLATGASQVKFNDPDIIDFSSVTKGKLDWIALINNSANWNYYTSNSNYNTGGYSYIGSTTCPAITIATNLYVNGKWTGKQDTNWFNCGNWDTFVVPDETVDVQVGDNLFDRQAIVSSTAPYASYYGNIALTKNLTITGEKVEIISGNSNILEVHGNLLLDTPAGALDMDDGNSLTSDGQLFLYGNWTNNIGNAAFEEGNGTVQFVGSTSQIINNVMPEGTETFYNVIMNNNFDTQVSNDLIATGDLTLNANKIITVNTNDYLQINKSLINNGTFNIKNTGQLVQVEDSGVNSGTGNFVMERTATVARTTDYVYWSSPISNFQVGNVNPSSWLRYKWIPTIPRTYASNFGGWLATPANEVMEKGKGYIIRGPYTNPTATFTNAAPNNLPNNGIIPVGVERSTYDGAPYTYLSGSTTLTVVKDDDNYNLLGNPYPSAVDVQKFLALNTNLAGHIRLWTHGTPIQSSLFNGQSFYNSFGYTYSVTDYLYVNYTGISSGPGDYAIASGQGFFVTMNHSSASASENVIFNNSMRRDATLGTIFNNSVFYRKANTNERNRIWLDILDDKNASVRTLVGYVQGATLDKDRMYDAKVTVDSNLNIYSLIQDESQIIQARAVPFDKDDRVPLGVSIPLKVGNTTSTLGTYKIAIAFVDGLFQNKNQDIYLEDKLLNVIHDLRKDPYTFESVSGRFDNRFVLRYTNKNKSLGTDHFKEYRNSVVVAADAGQVKIMSSIEAIKKVAVYDILGREIFTKNNINAMELSIKDIIINRQALVVKVVLENGQEISKKIIL